jgi:hypothetical protein
MLATPINASATVQLADLALWNMGCGNEGAVLLLWGAGQGSSLHDVNMLVAATVGAKAVFYGAEAGQGQGYANNLWWPAVMAYQPQLLSRLALSAAPAGAAGSAVRRQLQRQQALASEAQCSLTATGLLISSPGPFFWVGVNFEHSVGYEVSLLQGSTNQLFLGLQTEESLIALHLNGTHNAVVLGALLAFWNASQHSPAQVVAQRAQPLVASSVFDLSYRVFSLAVPIAASEAALLIDTGSGSRSYDIPVQGQFAAAVAVLNPGAARAAPAGPGAGAS